MKNQQRAEMILKRTGARIANGLAVECYLTFKEKFREYQSNKEGELHCIGSSCLMLGFTAVIAEDWRCAVLSMHVHVCVCVVLFIT